MDYALLFPSKYAAAADLGDKPRTLTIKSAGFEILERKDKKAEKENKPIVRFESARKGWVLNRTNAEALVLMFGRKTEDWVGKRVTLYSKEIDDPFGDGKIWCIRVKGSPDIDGPKSTQIARGNRIIKVSVEKTDGAATAPLADPEVAEPGSEG